MIVSTLSPDQRGNNFGSVQVFHASSRCASNTRSSTYVVDRSFSAPLGLGLSLFQIFEQPIELLETRRPELLDFSNQLTAAASCSAFSRAGLRCSSISRSISPACSSTLRCRDTAGWLISKGARRLRSTPSKLM
jgi:hypothetical protein